MVKTEITITDYKDTSSTRTSFETNHGKMSAFKNKIKGTDEYETLIDDLKSHTNRLISVDIMTTVKDDKTYFNIREFYGAVAKQETNGTEVITPQKFTRPENIIMKPPIGRKEYDKDPVGLAIELAATGKYPMDLAIEAVKQAQEAFS